MNTEALVRFHFWKIALQASVGYDYTYMINPTHRIFKKEPAKTSCTIHGLQTEFMVGIDIGGKK